jgi:hypothetical protein
MAAIRKDLRWLPYTEEERELGEALEAAYQTMFAVGTSLTGGASRAAGLAATRAAVRTAEAEVAAVAARSVESAAASTGERLLGRLTSRLNPFNYAIDGLGSNFGNVRFRPPSGTSTALPEVADVTYGSTSRAGSRGRPVPIGSPEAATLPPSSQAELAIDEYLLAQGDTVERNAMEHQRSAGRQFDRYVNGQATEYKSFAAGADSKRIKETVNSSIKNGGQADRIIIDARGSGLTKEEAERGIRRAFGISRGKVRQLRIIGDGFDLVHALE